MLNASTIAIHVRIGCYRSSREKTKVVYSTVLGIIQIQRSFNLQLFHSFYIFSASARKYMYVTMKRLNRFFSRHTTNFAAGSASKDVALVAHLMGFLLWPTEWSSFDEVARDPLFVVFSTFFFVAFFFSLFVYFCFAVNTMSLLRIQTTFCGFSQFEIECMCLFVCLFLCVSVQLIVEKYCCDCLFHLCESL